MPGNGWTGRYPILFAGSFVTIEKWKDMIDGHFKFYKHVNDDPDFAKTLLDLLFERYLERAKK